MGVQPEIKRVERSTQIQNDKMSAQLVLKEFSGVPEITDGAFKLRQEALEAARPVARVTTPDEQMIAVEALRKLKDVRMGLETSRKAVKAPVLELGRKIDKIAAIFIQDVEKQEGRLQGLINHYQRKQLELKHQEEQKLELWQDKVKELRAKAAELREQIKQASGHQCTELAHQATNLEREAFDLEMQSEVAVVPSPDKPKGLAVRQRINFQVTNPILFVQAYPQLWKVSDDGETLKVDRMRVLDELNKPNGHGLFHKTTFPEEMPAGDNMQLVRPAGLRVYEEIKAHIR